MAVLKVLVIMYVETFKPKIIVFIDNDIMCFDITLFSI